MREAGAIDTRGEATGTWEPSRHVKTGWPFVLMCVVALGAGGICGYTGTITYGVVDEMRLLPLQDPSTTSADRIHSLPQNTHLYAHHDRLPSSRSGGASMGAGSPARAHTYPHHPQLEEEDIRQHHPEDQEQHHQQLSQHQQQHQQQHEQMEHQQQTNAPSQQGTSPDHSVLCATGLVGTELMPSHPQTDASTRADPLDTQPVTVCCQTACGVCGGKGCSRRPGTQCCVGPIFASMRRCTVPTDTTCIIPHVTDTPAPSATTSAAEVSNTKSSIPKTSTSSSSKTPTTTTATTTGADHAAVDAAQQLHPTDTTVTTDPKTTEKARRLLVARTPVPIEPYWDGEYTTFPTAAPAFDDVRPDARGQRAYVVLFSPIQDKHRYTCLALAHLTSLQQTNPHPDIHIVVAILLLDAMRFHQGDWTPEQVPELIGQDVHDAFVAAGATRFVLWRELELKKGKMLPGYWQQAFSKLQVFNMLEYEKVVFSDADTLVLKNIDFLFDESDFAAGTTWSCEDATAPKEASGGFWVLQPSAGTWSLIQRYLRGRDPCGYKWRMGDMKIIQILFTDMAYYLKHLPHHPKHDGDIKAGYHGRCGVNTRWPHRYDSVSGEGRASHTSPRNRLKLLNASFDVLVGTCDVSTFTEHAWDDRYNKLNGKGKTQWDRWDAFTVHLSCGGKPRCHRDKSKDDEMPPCKRDILRVWDSMFEKYGVGLDFGKKQKKPLKKNLLSTSDPTTPFHTSSVHPPVQASDESAASHERPIA